MFRKNYISLFLFITLFAVGGISASAQNIVGGKVELKGADDKKTSFKGAKIDCYRIDVTETCGSSVSDEEGKFSFKGLPKDAKVVFALSGSGLAPQVVPNVRLDNSNTLIALEGNGVVPTEDAVREAAISYAKEKGELTDAQKANLADIEKRISEKAKKDEQSKANNKLRDGYLKDGNAAFNKGDYELAIEKYRLGYDIDPEFLGAAPVFLNNKATALEKRAVDGYNIAVKSKDADNIRNARAEVVKDFTEALIASTKSYNMTKNAKPTAGTTPASLKENAETSKQTIKEIFKYMGQMNLGLASNLTTEEDATNVVSIYQTSLIILPDDPDVIAGLAMALYSSGDFKGSMEEKKQSLEYWNKFKKVAPKGHKQQATADGMIEFLKEEVK